MDPIISVSILKEDPTLRDLSHIVLQPIGALRCLFPPFLFSIIVSPFHRSIEFTLLYHHFPTSFSLPTSMIHLDNDASYYSKFSKYKTKINRGIITTQIPICMQSYKSNESS